MSESSSSDRSMPSASVPSCLAERAQLRCGHGCLCVRRCDLRHRVYAGCAATGLIRHSWDVAVGAGRWMKARRRPLQGGRRRHRRGAIRPPQDRRADQEDVAGFGRRRRRQTRYRLFRQCDRYRRHRSGDLHRRGRVEVDDRRHDAPLRHDRHRLRGDERQRRDLRRRARRSRWSTTSRSRRPMPRCSALSRSGSPTAPSRPGISISGGEIAQLKDVVRGFDLVGMAVGLVPLDHIITGRDSSRATSSSASKSNGIHSNGLTLARQVLFEQRRAVDRRCPPRTRHTVGRRASPPDFDLCARDPRHHQAGADRKGIDQHHRRRLAEPAPGRGDGRVRDRQSAAGAADLPADRAIRSSRRARRCSKCSIWASAFALS